MTITLCKSIVILVCASLITACNRSNDQAKGQQGAPEYAVIQVEPSNSELNNVYPATINGIQDVEIRPKVSGFITKLCVDEGAKVRKGTPLFLIDRVQYQAAVESAEAAVKLAEANVATSKLTVSTKKELAAKNIISDYELQTAQNELLSREASLAQAKAQLTNARNDLSYTTIVSPSDGIVGTIPNRVGSLVNTSTNLTVVSDISSMYVYFSVNEKDLLNLTRQQQTNGNLIAEMPEVSLQLADGSIYPQKGRISTLSGVIDKSTGAATLRATFPNPESILRSGGTGKIMLPQAMDSVVIIPQKATYELQDKKFVYTVSDSSTVVNTPITVLPLNDGQNYVVLSGLNFGNKVIVEGVASLRNGMKITPVTPQEAAQKAAAAKAQGAAGKQ